MLAKQGKATACLLHAAEELRGLVNGKHIPLSLERIGANAYIFLPPSSPKNKVTSVIGEQRVAEIEH